jgi:hypothetical protein
MFSRLQVIVKVSAENMHGGVLGKLSSLNPMHPDVHDFIVNKYSRLQALKVHLTIYNPLISSYTCMSLHFYHFTFGQLFISFIE